jgi:ketosteroid isomerase-like protein
MKPKHVAGASIATALTTAIISCATDPVPLPTSDELAALVRSSEEANQALVRGDIDRYNDLVSMSDDFMLMPPNGRVSRGTPKERDMRMRAFFKGGTQTQELVQAYTSPDMIVLAVIEHAHIAVADVPMQDWALRVTLVYRREGTQWKLAHRHADPLVHGITWEQAAQIAKGPE